MQKFTNTRLTFFKQHTMHWLTAVGQHLYCLRIIKYFIINCWSLFCSYYKISSTPSLCKVYCVVVLFLCIYVFLLKKTLRMYRKNFKHQQIQTNLRPECVLSRKPSSLWPVAGVSNARWSTIGYTHNARFLKKMYKKETKQKF